MFDMGAAATQTHSEAMKGRDVTGLRFGMLTAVRPLGFDNHGVQLWLCRCDCGGESTPGVYSLLTGNSKSCGCRKRAVAVERSTTHGHTRNRSATPEYKAWSGMIGRCHRGTDKRFALYGARGITVCERWRESFANFLADMGPRPSPKHTIDREDNDGNYEPGNCRWATPKQQARNTRQTVVVEYRGERVPLRELAERFGHNYYMVYYRYRTGWSIEDAMHTPSGVTRGKANR